MSLSSEVVTNVSRCEAVAVQNASNHLQTNLALPGCVGLQTNSTPALTTSLIAPATSIQTSRFPPKSDGLSVLGDQVGSSTIIVNPIPDPGGNYRTLPAGRNDGSPVVYKIFNDNLLDADMNKLMSDNCTLPSTVHTQSDNCASYERLSAQCELGDTAPVSGADTLKDLECLRPGIGNGTYDCVLNTTRPVQFLIKFDHSEETSSLSISSRKPLKSSDRAVVRNTCDNICGESKLNYSYKEHESFFNIVIDGETNATKENSALDYWICPVCGSEIADLVTAHLQTHSLFDLIKVIEKSIKLYKRSPRKEYTVTDIKSELEDNGTKSVSESCIISTYNKQRSIKKVTKGRPKLMHRLRNVANKFIKCSDTARTNNINFHSIEIEQTTDSKSQIKVEPKCKEDSSDPDDVFEISAPPSPNPEIEAVPAARNKQKRCSSRAPHPCSVCGKVFSNRGNVVKHMTLHSALKPWNCPICNVGFNSNRAWEHHNIQNHSTDRAHTCPVCNKSFAVRDNLKEHLLFHGPKNKTCDICGKLFWTQKCVSRHRKRHFPEKQHECGMCSKAFAIKWDYRLHCRKVHGMEYCPS